MNIKLYCSKHPYTELIVHEIKTKQQEVGFFVVECIQCKSDYSRLLEKLKEENRTLKKNALLLDALKMYHEHYGPEAAEITGEAYVRVGWNEAQLLKDHPKFKDAIPVKKEYATNPEAYFVPKSIIEDWNNSWKKAKKEENK